MNKSFNTLKLMATFFFAGLMIFAGINHFISPEFYDPFIPNFLPKLIVNYGSGVIEIVIGILMIISKYRIIALLSFVSLMILFLPIHILDVFKVSPAIGSVEMAILRIFIQFFLIFTAYLLIVKTDR